MFLSEGALVSTKTPISLTQGSSYWPWVPPMSTHGWPSAYAGIYSKQLWVYVAVRKLAYATARLPIHVYEKNDLDRPQANSHPLTKLLEEPNPGLSGFRLNRWTSATGDIYGESFWYKRRVRDPQRGGIHLYPFHPSAMSENDDGSWTFDNGSKRMSEIPPSDLVVFNEFNPNSLTRGLSPLEPLRSTLENEWSARTATSSFWQRGARPGMALSHKGQLSEPAQQRLKAQMDAVSAGADKTGVTIVLEEGMEPKPMTLTAEEAQYIETRKLNREEVCAAYDIPPPVLHILDRATFSNITEQMRSMYRDTMAPRLKAFEDAIKQDLRLAEFSSDEVYPEFLMDEVLRGDFETRQDALKKADHMTLAEKRKIENLPYIPGTDRIFLNSATLPLDAIDATYGPDATPTPEGAGMDVIPLSVARSVMGRLTWQQSLEQVDPKALVAGVETAGPVLQALALERANGGDIASLRERISALVKE